MARYIGLALFFCLCLNNTQLKANIAVIAHPNSEFGQLSRADVSRLYIGKSIKSPQYGTIKLADNQSNESQESLFFKTLTGFSAKMVHTIWSQKHFSGQKHSLTRFTSNAETLYWVSKTPGAIAFVDKSLIDSSVQVLFEVDAQSALTRESHTSTEPPPPCYYAQ